MFHTECCPNPFWFIKHFGPYAPPPQGSWPRHLLGAQPVPICPPTLWPRIEFLPHPHSGQPPQAKEGVERVPVPQGHPFCGIFYYPHYPYLSKESFSWVFFGEKVSSPPLPPSPPVRPQWMPFRALITAHGSPIFRQGLIGILHPIVGKEIDGWQSDPPRGGGGPPPCLATHPYSHFENPCCLFQRPLWVSMSR